MKQNEHIKLRAKIDDILKLSNDQSCNYDGIHTKFNEIDANFQKYKQITEDTINNLKVQIEYQNTVSASIGNRMLFTMRILRWLKS